MKEEPIQVTLSWGNDKWSDTDSGAATSGQLNAAACSLDLSTADMKRVLNAVHERAHRLLRVWTSAMHQSYRKPDGTRPTKEEMDMLYEGQKAHFDLQERIREFLKANSKHSNPELGEQP